MTSQSRKTGIELEPGRAIQTSSSIKDRIINLHTTAFMMDMEFNSSGIGLGIDDVDVASNMTWT